MEFFKILYPYVKPYRGKVIGSILLSIVLAALKGFQAYLVKPIFDKGLSSETSQSEVWGLAGLLFGLMVLNFPCRYFHFYWIRYVVDKATCSVRDLMFSKMQRLPMPFFIQNKQGTLISNLLNDTHTFSQGFKGAVDLIREPLTALAMLGLAFYRDWQLTLIIIFVSPLFIIIFNASGNRVKKNQSEVQEEMGHMTHSISEGLSGHKIIKAYNLKNYVAERFSLTQNQYFQSLMKTTRVEELAHPLVELVGALAFSFIIVFAHYRISHGFMTTGDFVSFITAMALLMDPIRKYSQANIKINQAKAASDRIMQVLKEQEEIDTGKEQLSGIRNNISIENITFSYQEKPVLKNFSLEIRKGMKVALVGLSGSGKSTLINLLLGLYPLQKGKIAIDGVPIENISKKSLRGLFALVSQDIFLFNDTVKANLILDRTIDSNQMKDALKVAHATDFVDKLELGIDTILGDRGAKLSGGQQQRITIARAYLRQTDVLLFDEATSALDNESEKIVQEAIDEMAQGKTVIAVAHRLSTIKDYDHIVVLHEGSVVEQGKHSELMGNHGEYYRLYQLGQTPS